MAAPPAPPVANNLIRITRTSRADGQLCENTFDYVDATVTPISSANLDACCTNWKSFVDTTYLACLSPSSEMVSISAQELHFGTTPTQVQLDTPGTVGTAGTSCLPLEVGATLARVTDLKGKHGRGRITMPGVPDTFVTPTANSSELNATGVTAYDALGVKLSSVVPISAISPVVSTRPVPPSVLIDNAKPVTGYITRIILGTQRRRKVGRGI